MRGFETKSQPVDCSWKDSVAEHIDLHFRSISEIEEASCKCSLALYRWVVMNRSLWESLEIMWMLVGSGGGTVRYETALSLGLRRHSKRINELIPYNSTSPCLSSPVQGAPTTNKAKQDWTTNPTRFSNESDKDWVPTMKNYSCIIPTGDYQLKLSTIPKCGDYLLRLTRQWYISSFQNTISPSAWCDKATRADQNQSGS